MKIRPLDVARVVAWVVAVGSVAAVAIGYRDLPDSLPLTQWTYAPKTVLLALRVPLINLLTVGLVELLARSLSRAQGIAGADAAAAALLLTAAAKSGIEGAGILMLPRPISWTVLPLVAVLVVGLGTAAFLGREFFEPNRWRQLHMTRLETVAAVVLVSGIAVLNLPLVFR